jgi:predicted AAA+ superfamily ATPase
VVTWCCDEIQVGLGWERFVRRLLDDGGVEAILTGSPARLLSREVATFLRGRAWELLFHPFSRGEVPLQHGQVLRRDPSRPATVTERGWSRSPSAGGWRSRTRARRGPDEAPRDIMVQPAHERMLEESSAG